ncbi:MAG: DUF6064 family protein [Caldimonas sp.]
MTEWWTYRLSDFLMFSARTYRRLFELYNTEVWPLPVVAFIGGALGLAIAWRRVGVPVFAVPIGLTLLAACWLWIAWAFHLQRYATILTAAPWFAAAFALEALTLIAIGMIGVRRQAPSISGWRRSSGLGLFGFAVLGYPWIGVMLGRPLSQAEVFGMAPDPTAIGTLGVLLLTASGEGGARRFTHAMTWPIPFVWCLVSGATLWTMDAPEALLLPLLAATALAVAIGSRRSKHTA